MWGFNVSAHDLISSVTAWVRASISVSRETQQQRFHTQIHPMAAMLISWLLTDSTEALTGLVSGNMGCIYVCWMSDYPGGRSACVLSFSLIAWMCTADISCPAFVAKMNVEYLTLTKTPFQGVLGLSVQVPEAPKQETILVFRTLNWITLDMIWYVDQLWGWRDVVNLSEVSLHF